MLITTNSNILKYNKSTNQYSNINFYSHSSRRAIFGHFIDYSNALYCIDRGLFNINPILNQVEELKLKGKPCDLFYFNSTNINFHCQFVRSGEIIHYLLSKHGELFEWNLNTSQLRYIPISLNTKKNLKPSGLDISSSGILYFSCTNNGIIGLDPVSGHIVHQIPYSNFLLGSIPRGRITDLTLNNQVLWATHQPAGLVRVSNLTTQFPSIELYGKSKGLNNYTLNSCLTDSSGNVWLGTFSGISKWDDTKKKFIHFASEYGIIDNQFTSVKFRDVQGTMFMATSNNFVQFNPSTVIEDTSFSPVFISDWIVNAKSRPEFINNQKINLTYGERNFIIKLQSHKPLAKSSFYFTYKLNKKGINDEYWVKTFDNSIHFTGIEPGTYVLEFKACYGSTNCSKIKYSVELNISSIWYKSPIFILFISLLIFFSIYLYNKHKTYQFNKIQIIRNKISHDLHDDIGSTLASISIYSEVAKHNSKKERVEILNKIGESSREMIENLNDIVWSINPKHDNSIDFLQRIRNFATHLLNPVNIEFELISNFEKYNFSLDMQTRRNLFLIYKEALHNALKYSKCTKIMVSIIYQGGKLQMTISDNGQGFNPDIKNTYNGNGLISMQQRANSLRAKLEIQSYLGYGTTITVVL